MGSFSDGYSSVIITKRFLFPLYILNKFLVSWYLASFPIHTLEFLFDYCKFRVFKRRVQLIEFSFLIFDIFVFL